MSPDEPAPTSEAGDVLPALVLSAAAAGAQAVEWMHALIGESLRTRFYASPAVKTKLPALETAVANGAKPALAAALELMGSTHSL
jgi:hypothetical protein